MTQSGEKGNGKKPDIDPNDMTVFEPVFASEEDVEPIGWWKTDPDQEDGEFILDPSSELDDSDDSPNPN
ncbi:hypothetical protein [Thermoleptolyngbya sp. C42_A2020_037]|uniref:hypothetical protein n=1 Tax=Thermoleptolyngbya sp. C42_A2020_037 TaxID=2747799 RepID=UPI0019E656CC|nr:hypothetical protein [Thermoleptolyngbya sp. C42_A2020_037]MBF2085405.1 hypothetical protein [Thermoleptolyngbya sp. C42_A2020_037]